MQLRTVSLLYDASEVNAELERVRHFCLHFPSMARILQDETLWRRYRQLWYHRAMQETNRALFATHWETHVRELHPPCFEMLWTMSQNLQSRVYLRIRTPWQYNDQEVVELRVTDTDLHLRYLVGANHVCHSSYPRSRTGTAF